MKKYVIFLVMLLSATMAFAQGMSDAQVLEFVEARHKAGASQSQIVTGLMQRGVKIDQIRRMRDVYQRRMTDEGRLRSAAENPDNTRFNANNDGTRY